MFYQRKTARKPPKGPKNAVFVPGDLDLQNPNSSELRTKHVFCVNLPQNPFSSSRDISYHTTPHHHHNHFMALFPGPPGWAGARWELLEFMVQGKINRGRHRPSGWVPLQTHHSRDISYTNKKNHRLMAPKTEPSTVHSHSLRAVTIRKPSLQPL